MIDGVDQTIFQAADMASVLANYQSYDKALDIYYLVIAYTSTLRNWPEPAAFRIGQFLWRQRLHLQFRRSGELPRVTAGGQRADGLTDRVPDARVGAAPAQVPVHPLGDGRVVR